MPVGRGYDIEIGFTSVNLVSSLASDSHLGCPGCSACSPKLDNLHRFKCKSYLFKTYCIKISERVVVIDCHFK